MSIYCPRDSEESFTSLGSPKPKVKSEPVNYIKWALPKQKSDFTVNNAGEFSTKGYAPSSSTSAKSSKDK